MSEASRRDSRRNSTRSNGPGAAARSAGANRRGPSGRSDRPRSRPDTDRPAASAVQAAGGVAPSRSRHAAVQKGERRPGMWRQIAVLGAVLIAVALAIAVPLRSYLHQRDDLAKALAQQQQLEQQVADLQQKKAALQDPNYVKAEARRRLQYVSPGETVYRVVAPQAAAPTTTGSKEAAGSAKSSTAAMPAEQPWYGQMWDTLTEDAGKK